MITQFQSDLTIIQQEVCIEPSKFVDGKIPSQITVTYKNKFPYNYKLNRVDEKGNYCYRLLAAGFGKKKKKKNTPPCECSASISVEYTTFPHFFGDPFIYHYTTSPCAISASISNSSNADIVNSPPPSGSILISFGDNGYPSAGNTISTITVITDTGTCTASVQVQLFSPPG